MIESGLKNIQEFLSWLYFWNHRFQRRYFGRTDPHHWTLLALSVDFSVLLIGMAIALESLLQTSNNGEYVHWMILVASIYMFAYLSIRFFYGGDTAREALVAALAQQDPKYKVASCVLPFLILAFVTICMLFVFARARMTGTGITGTGII